MKCKGYRLIKNNLTPKLSFLPGIEACHFTFTIMATTMGQGRDYSDVWLVDRVRPISSSVSVGVCEGCVST